MANEPLRTCKKCGLDFPVSEFPLHNRAPGLYCARCVAAYRAAKRTKHRLLYGQRDDKWDWAAALCKTVKNTAQREHQVWGGTFDAELLRCLYQLQGGRCALGNQILITPADTLIKGAGISKWRDGLPDAVTRGLSIDIVCVDPATGWIAGNVMLIAHMYVDLFVQAGSIVRFKEWCEKPIDTKVMVYDTYALAHIREERCKMRLDAVAQREEIPWK